MTNNPTTYLLTAELRNVSVGQDIGLFIDSSMGTWSIAEFGLRMRGDALSLDFLSLSPSQLVLRPAASGDVCVKLGVSSVQGQLVGGKIQLPLGASAFIQTSVDTSVVQTGSWYVRIVGS